MINILNNRKNKIVYKMPSLKAQTYVDANLMIWLKAQAKDEGCSLSHYIRWCIYEAKAKSDMKYMT